MSLDDLLHLAKRQLMDLLAQREHSEAELRAKLSRSLTKAAAKGSAHLRVDTSSEQEAVGEEIRQAVDEAIASARQKKWLRPPEEIASEVTAKLHQKNKGIEYINTYLKRKGLPTVAQDSEMELEKARTLVKNKYSDISDTPVEERPKLQARVARLLTSRGFDSEIVRKVLYEKFGD